MNILLEMEPKSWIVDQVIVFDWYDGPRAGLARMRRPQVEITFSLLAERPTQDGLDDRLYRISMIPIGTIDRLLPLLKFAGSVNSPIWVPRWDRPRSPEIKLADLEIEAAMQQATPTDIVVRSDNFIEFSGCFTAGREMETSDWFKHFKI